MWRRDRLPAARPLLCYSVGSLQSLISPLHRPGPSVSSCSWTLHDLFFHFLGRCVLCVLPVFARPLRLHTDLHWHKIAVSVLLYSRDLEDFLSHLYPARDSCAFPEEARHDSPVLHPQHIHTCHDVVDHSLR